MWETIIQLGAYQIDSVNTVTNEKRLNGFLERNRAELERNDWLVVGYIPGNLNTPDGLTKAISSASLRSLINGNTLRSLLKFKRLKLGNDYPHQNTILFILDQFMVERIWTQTCDERRAREEVHIGKQRQAVIRPLIRINCIWAIIRKLQPRSQNRCGFYERFKNAIKI